MRRTLEGIIKSLEQMLDIFLFFFIIILIWAFIGARVIGDLGGEPYDNVNSIKFLFNFRLPAISTISVSL
jgi:hypothetical protein